MGDRISIQFQNKKEKSVTLFSHWGGNEFANSAKDYVKELKNEIGENSGINPLDRLEPNTVMVDFIHRITENIEDKNKRISSDLYLGKDENDGDNSDNGNVIIKL